MSQEIVMVLGYPASGKTTLSQKYIDKGYVHLNRDKEGGSVAALLPKLCHALRGGKSVVLDNLFPTVELRRQFINAAKSEVIPIRCEWMATSLEDSQINALRRMWKLHNRLYLSPESARDAYSPNVFPVAVLFKYRKEFEKPTTAEGFAKVQKVEFVRHWEPEYKNHALLLDHDDTLRTVPPGAQYKFPTRPEEVVLLPNRTEVLKGYEQEGYKLLGVSNQSGIDRRQVKQPDVVACFDQTSKLLGVKLETAFCPHGVPPNCYCRKPQSGLGVYFIEKYKLDPKKCIFVGDSTTDKTFAQRLGFTYETPEKFFTL
jgi:HAD superfamily hydrolase (TIGR01662 family)